jgi:hypothetical protein
MKLQPVRLSVFVPSGYDRITYAYTGDVWLGLVGAIAVVPSYVVKDDLEIHQRGCELANKLYTPMAAPSKARRQPKYDV